MSNRKNSTASNQTDVPTDEVRGPMSLDDSDDAVAELDDVNQGDGMSLGDVALPDGVPAKDDDGVPYCRTHHCRMKQSSGGKKDSRTSYYTCPVNRCKETAQKIKTSRPGVVPPLPLKCVRCSEDKKPVYCERDPSCSTAACVVLKCPNCHWKSNAMAVPQLAAAHFASRPVAPVAGIGDR